MALPAPFDTVVPSYRPSTLNLPNAPVDGEGDIQWGSDPDWTAFALPANPYDDTQHPWSYTVEAKDGQVIGTGTCKGDQGIVMGIWRKMSAHPIYGKRCVKIEAKLRDDDSLQFSFSPGS